MSKKTLASLIIIVLLASASLGFYRYQQYKIKAYFKEVWIPNAEKSAKTSLGQEVEIRHGQIEMDGMSFKMRNLVCRSKGSPVHVWRVKESEVGFSNWFAMFSQPKINASLKDIEYKLEGKKILGIGRALAEQLESDEENQKYAADKLEFTDISIPLGQAKNGEFRLPRLELHQTLLSFNLAKWAMSASIKEINAEKGKQRLSLRETALDTENFKPEGALWAKGKGDFSLKDGKLTEEDKELLSFGDIKIFYEGSDDKVTEKGGIGYVKLAIPEDDESFESLRDLGYHNQVVLSASLAFTYLAQGGLFDIENYTIALKEGGALGFNLKSSGLDKAFLTQFKNTDEQTQRILLAKVKLLSVGVSYHDDSLMERALKAAAKEQKQSVKQFKQKMISSLAEFDQAISSPKLSLLNSALSGFIKNPQSLCIKASSPTPVSIEYLLNAGPLPLLLQYDIEAGPCPKNGAQK